MSKELAKRDMSDIGTVLEVNKGAVLQALPKSIKPDRFLRVCLNTIRGNPDLQKCTAASLYAGIMQSAQFGLEIGVLNQAHLVPYWNSDKRCFEAQFQVGYLGLRDLAERYGDVIDGDAQAVHEKDLFDYAQGNEPYVTHKPSKDQDRGQIVHFYCWAQPKEGKIKVHVMSKQEVEAHRDRFVRKKKDGSFGPAWTMTFEAMGLKTVIRRNYKLLARSPELREAIALDELQEVSIPQNLGLEVEYAEREEARQTNQQRLAAVKAQQTAPAEGNATPPPSQPAPQPSSPPDGEPPDYVLDDHAWNAAVDEMEQEAHAFKATKEKLKVNLARQLQGEERVHFVNTFRDVVKGRGKK